MVDDEASSDDNETASDLEDMKVAEVPHDECVTKHEDMTVRLASQKESDGIVENQLRRKGKSKKEDDSSKKSSKSTKKKKENDLDLTNEQKHDQKLNGNDKKKQNQEMEKIRPSEEITCMNNKTYNPKNCPYYEHHMEETDLDMLLKEDSSAYLFGNSHAVDTSCYECGRNIVTPKVHKEHTVKKHEKEKYLVMLKRDKPMFTCIEHRKKLNNCRFCLCFNCMQKKILNPDNAKKREIA